MAAEPPASPMVSHEDRADERKPTSSEYRVFCNEDSTGRINFFLSAPFSRMCIHLFPGFVQPESPSKMIDGIHADERRDKDPRMR